MTDERLDAALVTRGLARSRSQAARLIKSGVVSVDSGAIVRPSARVGSTNHIVVADADHYVSRAAHKLIAALDAFAVDPAGRVALDVGASTGGFTQVLLERGADPVISLDVGHGQLDPQIRSDPRVVVLEGINARSLSLADVEGAGSRGLPDLVVADVSFIPLGLILPAIVAVLGRAIDIVALIKPQFEVGRSGIREGIVRRPALRDEAVMGVLWAAWDLGLPTAGVISSPIVGTAGNREYLAWFSTTAGTNPTEWTQQVSAIA